MKIVRKTMMLSALIAGIAIGGMGTARADAFAQSILIINNFRLTHASAVPYDSTEFDLLTGTNDAHATASLNGVFANGAQSLGILSGLTPDVAHQWVGNPSPPLAENDFAPFGTPPAVPGTFGYADQDMDGSAITVGSNPAGATARTRAAASLEANGIASGNSDVGTSTTFSFIPLVSDFMVVAFDAVAFTQAHVSAGSTPTTNAAAKLTWTMNIVDRATNAIVFTYAPSELNAMSNVSHTDGFAGTQTYTNSQSYLAATASPLLAGNTYQITIAQTSLAEAFQNQAVPEPGTLAIFGLGLLGLTAVGRRRKQ